MTQIRALVAGQHQEPDRLTRDQRARAARITREALARVQLSLATVDPASWAANQGRAVSAQLQGLLDELVKAQGTALATGTTRAVATGARSATRVLQGWSSKVDICPLLGRIQCGVPQLHRVVGIRVLASGQGHRPAGHPGRPQRLRAGQPGPPGVPVKDLDDGPA